ncbi:tryptophan-rich sensory protein [Bifidobacterium sp. W8101]|uniref:TspO/MBR family protein n=1 Tax=Bifidobacterium TaxID=1678 RepID=UPI0018DE216B|nr:MULTISPECIES: TspO/MBR family protein [Bifidobacterium]MBI0126983.1 tryptophan-rich sensory protein [Bifidobacterium choladohabitans]MBI0128552.1 tryptophan-rich sensory protein [Bifidobacterium sp. W8103]MBI0139075.1 tryptophan-rich sensory protein [Bifidobacterium sp. W8105]MBI0149439.1 tryptophan-rich sensory protein [Bifidobacterium sp. W8107]
MTDKDNPRRLWTDDEDPVERAKRTSPAMQGSQSNSDSSSKSSTAAGSATAAGNSGNSSSASSAATTPNSSNSNSSSSGSSPSGAATKQSGDSSKKSSAGDTGAEETANGGGTRSDRSGNENEAAQESSKGRGWKLFEDILLWVAWVAMVGFNGYAEVYHFNGTTVGGLARKVDLWIMPAGYVFAIWGVIYIALAIWLFRFCLAGPSRKRLGFLPFTLSGLLFVATCCLNIAWLALWHMERNFWALVIILILTVLAWMLYALVRRDATEAGTPTAAKALDWIPLSIYASWLSVATLVNAGYMVVAGHRVGNAVQGFATIIVVGALLAVAYLMNRHGKDWVFGLVVIWACLGIGIRIFSFAAAMGVLVIALTAVGAFLVYFPWSRFRLVRR